MPTLPRLTPHTLTEPEPFLAMLDTVARDDHCIASEEHELGVVAVAVPLRNAQGHTVAALNVMAAPDRATPQFLLAEQLPRLRAAVRDLREML